MSKVKPVKAKARWEGREAKGEEEGERRYFPRCHLEMRLATNKARGAHHVHVGD